MKLSEELEKWRADRPDEWKMDEFIRNADALEKQLAELQDKLRWRDAREELPIDNSYIIIQTKSGEIPAYWSGFAKDYKHKEAVVFNSKSFKRFIFWRYATYTADKHEAS